MMIEFRQATKRFGEKVIFEDVNLKIEKGKIVGIIGHNGSGKSVLFKIICGFIPLEQGEVIVRGEVVGKDVDIPASLGVIIETPGFLPYLTGLQNLSQLASIHRRIDRQRIMEVLELVGLDPHLQAKVSTYSLGMRQRLGIAQAVMESPEILILDEPFNGLDKAGVDKMRAFLLSLKAQGTTILLASHQATDIEILCDEVYEFCDQHLHQVQA